MRPAKPQPRLLSPQEVANLTGCSALVVWRAIKRGELDAWIRKTGRLRRVIRYGVEVNDAQAWKVSRSVEPQLRADDIEGIERASAQHRPRQFPERKAS